MSARALTDKQKRFSEEYLIDLNGTQAAIRAGYSPKTADVQASRLLTNANVQSYISTLQRRRSQRTRITADRVLKELASVAYSDISEVTPYSNNGVTLNDSKTLPKRVRAAVQSITFVETTKPDGTVTVKKSVKMYDKIAALQSLMQHLGLLKPEPVATKEELIQIFEAAFTDASDTPDSPSN